MAEKEIFIQNKQIIFTPLLTGMNKKWVLEFEAISIIATGQMLRLDDDSLFVVFVDNMGKVYPINITYDIDGFDILWEIISKNFNTPNNYFFGHDQISVIYPANYLLGHRLFKPKFSSIKTFLAELKKLFGFAHFATGVLEDNILDYIKNLDISVPPS